MAEYYIKQIDSRTYTVAKFSGDSQPENVYFVAVKIPKGSKTAECHCDCPNKRRGKHVNDKHGVMVAKWLLAGKPEGHFDSKGDWHGAREGIANSWRDAGAANAEAGSDDSLASDELAEGNEEDDSVSG